MAKRRDHIPSEPLDPAAEYCEWTENRYNPGYWASRGEAPPHLKNLWSTKDRRWLGMLYIATAVVGTILALRRGVKVSHEDSTRKPGGRVSVGSGGRAAQSSSSRRR